MQVQLHDRFSIFIVSFLALVGVVVTLGRRRLYNRRHEPELFDWNEPGWLAE